MMRCTVCGEKFSSERNFDAHRVGPYPHASPKHPVKVGVAATMRRCLSVVEMTEKGMFLDKYGRWAHPYGKPQTLPLPVVNRPIAA